MGFLWMYLTQSPLVAAKTKTCKYAHTRPVNKPRCSECGVAKARDWEKRNREAYLANKRAYRLRHLDAEKARIHAHYLANRELACERARVWGQENPERRRETHKKWLAANPDFKPQQQRNRRAMKKAAGQFTRSEWLAIVKKQGGKCAECQAKSKLTADHIIPLSKGGSNYACNIQGLCFICNCKKHAKIRPGTQATLFDRVAA